MNAKLKEYCNALSHLKTSDEAALRRSPLENDDDGFMFNFGSPYLIDAQHKILLSKAIRRLNSKTQVLTGILNKHVRTRLSHTYEVISFAVLAARILGLNENLCYAIALGHDIGHPPLGHSVEKFISKVSGKTFRHEIFALVITQKIERQGKGLNLTYQVLEGILNHSRGSDPLFLSQKSTPEANLVMFADKIAYVWADINDIFYKTKLCDLSDFPKFKKLIEKCGKTQRERTAFMLSELCFESSQEDKIIFFSSVGAEIFSKIKAEMHKIYPTLKLPNIPEILEKIYGFLSKKEVNCGADPALILALMADDEVITLYNKKRLQTEDLNRCSVAEIIPHLIGKNIDLSDPDLKWDSPSA